MVAVAGVGPKFAQSDTVSDIVVVDLGLLRQIRPVSSVGDWLSRDGDQFGTKQQRL